MKKYAHLILGGTFDHLHQGHKTLIDKALAIAEKITIGIAQKKLYQNKFLSESIEDYEKRKKSVRDYIKKKRMMQTVVVIPISDIYGTSLTDKSIDAILVTDMTHANGLIINKLRKEKGLGALDIVNVSLVKGPDGEVITSERIRSGEIDREGNNFQCSISNLQKKELLLPNDLREELRKPLGRVFRGNENELLKTAKSVVQSINRLKPIMVITVGDIITNSLVEVGFDPDLKIIDYHSRRQSILYPKGVWKLKQSKKYINKPGTVSQETAEEVREAMRRKGKQVLVIDGEEDLLALPAILFAPLHSLVLYGQMDLGVVAVEVTEEAKRTVGRILARFYS